MRVSDDQLRCYLEGCLHYTGSDWRSCPEWFTSAIEAWMQRLSQSLDQLPMHVIVDLWGLAWDGMALRLSSAFGKHARIGDDMHVVERWENEMLDPISKEARVMEAWEMVRCSPDRRSQSERLLLLLARQLAAHAPAAANFSLPAARRIARSIRDELPDYETGLQSAESFCQEIADADHDCQELGELLDSCLLHLRWSELLGE